MFNLSIYFSLSFYCEDIGGSITKLRRHGSCAKATICLSHDRRFRNAHRYATRSFDMRIRTLLWHTLFLQQNRERGWFKLWSGEECSRCWPVKQFIHLIYCVGQSMIRLIAILLRPLLQGWCGTYSQCTGQTESKFHSALLISTIWCRRFLQIRV